MSEAQARARSTLVDCDQIEAELRRVVAARDEVLAIVSHDLRNPLSAVQLSARLLGELGLDERARKHLEMIQRAVRSMSRLIEDLLDAVSIDSSKLTLDVRPVPVAEVMSELRERNEVLARDRGIELRVTCEAPPGAPPGALDVTILADRPRVLQVFSNLIANAATFCRTGGAVSIGCQLAGDAVEFSVAGTGPGIDPGLIPHLFEPYWSAPPSIRRRIGLGLYIAKGIVERHGGRIRVERSEMAGGDPAGSAGGAGSKAPRGVERSEMGGGDPAGSAGGAGGKAPRGIDARPGTGPAIVFTLPRAKAP